MLLQRITLVVALLISAVAGYFSIVGLMALFSGAVFSAALLGICIEAGKVTSVAWIHWNWQKETKIKWGLSVLVVLLMGLTSMGIFGFLSKAHLEQESKLADVSVGQQQIDARLETLTKQQEVNESQLKQMDGVVNGYIAKGYLKRSLIVKQDQEAERRSVQEENRKINEEIGQLKKDRVLSSTAIAKTEAEVGPVKYVAKLIYGENITPELMGKTVRGVILLIVFIFDPLALGLLVASQISYKDYNKDKINNIGSPGITSSPDLGNDGATGPSGQEPSPSTLVTEDLNVINNANNNILNPHGNEQTSVPPHGNKENIKELNIPNHNKQDPEIIKHDPNWYTR